MTAPKRSAPHDSGFRIPKWVGIDSLPGLVVRNRVMNRDELSALLQQFGQWTAEREDGTALPPIAQALRAEAEPVSLDAFIHALYNRYHDAGRPKSERWMDRVAVLLGGERCVLRIGVQARQFAEGLNRVGANRNIEFLQEIGSDTAIMQLDMLARRVRRPSVKERAREAVERIAAARALTLDQLGDRIVPSCGLDASGSCQFDFGSRHFWFVAGSNLQPKVRDAEGVVRNDLPAPRQSDDAAKAAQSIAAWKLLKASLRETLKVQTERLERAMVGRRDWAVEEFEVFFLHHPLMRHFTRLLIWTESTDDGRQRAFRVAEDLSFTDVRDEPLNGPLSGRIRIVHPLHLSAEERSIWTGICSDYEMLPPFDQMNRSVHSIEPGEGRKRRLDRHQNTKVNALSLLSRLARLGWEKADNGHGVADEHRKYSVPEDVTAVIRYADGIYLGDPRGADLQTIQETVFLRGSHLSQGSEDSAGPLRLGEVPELVLSETLRDLALLTSAAAQPDAA